MCTRVFEGCTQPLLYILLLDSVDAFWCCVGLLASPGIPCLHPSCTPGHAHALLPLLPPWQKWENGISAFLCAQNEGKALPRSQAALPSQPLPALPAPGDSSALGLDPGQAAPGGRSHGLPRSRLTLPLPALTPRPLPSSLWGARDRRGSIKGQECRSGCHGRARRAAGAAL